MQVGGPDGNGVLGGILQVSAGEYLSVALTTDGRVFAWGYGSDGQIGDGYRFEYNVYPKATRSAYGPGQLSGIAFVDAGSYHVMAIASATASPSATSVAFGNQQVGTTSAAQSVTIINGGGGPLTVNSVTLGGTNAGDFAKTGGCSGTVAPSASCSVNVTFTPTATGSRTATLTFDTNAGQTVVTLTGNGTPIPSPSPSPSASPSPSPVATYTVNASAAPSGVVLSDQGIVRTTGNGTVTPSGTTTYVAGSTATYTAVAASNATFTRWTLDGTYVGYASPLTFAVNGNHTLVAQFIVTPSFNDLGTLSGADQRMITFLAALGIVNPNGVNGSHQFQPTTAVKRAEMAAFVARVFGWQDEFHANTFPDKCDRNRQNCIDSELWNDVAALADYGVVGGYTDPATCASAGTTSPCYLPRDPVKRVQVVSIVARAFIKTPDLRPTGFWDRLAANGAQYTNVSTEGTQRSDLTTYRANAGEIPGQSTSTTFNNPEGSGSRLFVVQVLYQAFNAQFGTDRVP